MSKLVIKTRLSNTPLIDISYFKAKKYTKHRERIQKFKEKHDSNYIYKNKLDKACFSHDVAYADSKDLAARIVWDLRIL